MELTKEYFDEALSRFDQKIEALDHKIDQKIEALDHKIDSQTVELKRHAEEQTATLAGMIRRNIDQPLHGRIERVEQDVSRIKEALHIE